MQSHFTQEDPIGLAGGMNLYGYAGGDPVNYSDPFGLCPRCIFAGVRGGAAVGGSIGSVFPGPGTVIGSILGGIGGGIAAYLLADAIADAVEGEGGPGRTIDDPATLEGATPDEVKGAIPDGWIETPTRDGEGSGVRYSNPERAGEQVRIMKGKANDPNPVKRGEYVRVSKDGKVSDPIPLKGNPSTRPQ